MFINLSTGFFIVASVFSLQDEWSWCFVQLGEVCQHWLRLIGLTATLTNALFFVDNFRNRIQITVATIESTQVSSDDIQALGEELSEYLGQVIESKIIVNQAVDILNNLQ